MAYDKMKRAFARTKHARRIVMMELSSDFDKWNKMSDEELMKEAQKTYPGLSGVPNRGQLLKYLTMNKLDEID